MKPDKTNLDSNLDRLLGLFSAPSSEQLIASREQIQQRLGSGSRPVAEATALKHSPARHGWWFVFAGAAAFAAVAAVSLMWPHREFVETAGGGLYRVSGETTQPLTAGETISVGEVLRTHDGPSAVVKLSDGSRVEMHSQTEFSLERADDGTRIHLIRGGVIVNAAKQRAGHLYVQTKDVTVSVVGTVFLVNLEGEGSHVAVIEGEVRVQQGATTKTLLPGQQLSTSPRMPSPPVKEEISWSRNAEAHMAMLRQSAAATSTSAPQNSPEARVAFEEASVRPADSGEAVGGRGGPQPMCSGRRIQIDPGRFAVTNTTLYGLIALAFGKDCAASYGAETLSGGPSWITSTSDRFDIKALLPEGTPSYTPKQFLNGEAPKLQMMLQALLADRFKLAVRRDTKEMTVYVLTVAKNGPKLKVWKEGDPDGFGAIARQIEANKASMADLAGMLARLTQRPVLDHTNLPGEYSFATAFAPLDNRPGASGPSLFTALEDDLGLKLEDAKEKVEILRIEHVERPSEN